MSKKLFGKFFIFLLVVGLLFAVAPTGQAQAQTPTTLNVAKWSDTVSVGVTGRPFVLFDGTTYHMWYGLDLTGGATELYYTTSTTPGSFLAGTKVTFDTAPLEQSSVTVIKEGDTFNMIAYGADAQEFALYTSSNGLAWTKGATIFDAAGMTDLGKIDAPFVFNDGGVYKLYFQLKNAAGDRYYIYLATSATVGGTYTNPSLVLSPSATLTDWDGKFVMHPTVVKDGGTYYMWYSAHNSVDAQRIGLATSPDGINWTKSPANPVIGSVGEPSVIKVGDTWHMYYLGTGSAVQHVSATGPFEFRTIQAAIDAAAAGDTIMVAAGTYTGQININKPVSIIGSGRDGANATIIASTAYPTVLLGATGTVGSPVLLQNLQIQGTGGIRTTVTPIDYFTMDNVWLLETGTGGEGFRLVTGHQMTHLTITASIIEGFTDGIIIEKTPGTGDLGTKLQHVTVTDTIFKNNHRKGLYIETLSDAVFTNVQLIDNGYYNAGASLAEYNSAGFDLNLKDGAYSNLQFINMTATGNGLYAKDGAALMIKARSDGTTYGANPATLDNVLISGGSFTGNERGIRFGEPNASNAGPTNVVITGATLLGNVKTYTGTDGSVYGDVVNLSLATVNATENWWGSETGPAAGQMVGDVKYLPYCTNAACTTFSEAKLSMDPATINATTCGPQYVDVMVTDVADLTAYHLEVTFDKTKVRIDSIVNGGFLHETDKSTVEIEPGTNLGNTTGKLIFGAYLQAKVPNGNPGPVSGSGSLIRINFTPLQGTTDFTVLSAILTNWPDAFRMPYSVTGVATATLTGGVVRNTNKGTNYCSLATAVLNAQPGHELQVLTDLTIPAMIPVDKALTLDLNGKVATASTGINALNVTTGGALNITDSGTTGKITGGTRAVMVNGGGSLTLTNGWLDGTGFDGVFVYGEGSSVTVNGGKITGLYYGISGNGSAAPSEYYGSTNILITGGTVQGGETAIFHPQLGPLTINGGEIIGGTYNGIEMKAGDLTITGGTITTSAGFVGTPAKTDNGNTQSGDAILIYNRAGYLGTMTVNITGGTITSANGYALREYTYGTEPSRTTLVNISGGHFTGGTPGAVWFATNTETVMELVGGDYSADPMVYVYDPYFTYKSGSRWYIAIPPSITSTDIQGYYLSGEQRQFSVVLTNPTGGANYAHVYVDFTIANAQVEQISLIEYSVDNGANWVALGTGPGTSFANSGTDIVGYFGKVDGGGFPLPAGSTLPTLFRVTFVTRDQDPTDFPTSYAVSMKLMSADATPTAFQLGDLSATMQVYDKPTIASTDIQGYYLTGEQREFHVTGTNPLTGGNYTNAMYKVTLPNTLVEDIANIQYYETYPTTGYVPLALTQVDDDVVAWFGLANYGGFPMAPGFSDSPSFKVTFATAKEYSVLIEQYDVALDPDRLLVAETFTATAYTPPVITSTTLAGPFVAGVPATVTLSIANTLIPEPFELVFNYPEGTVITYGSVVVTCTATGCDPIEVILDAEPTVLDFLVTFDEDWAGTVGVSLYDSDWPTADRLLASFTAAGVVNGDFVITGTFSMQGRTVRNGIPVTLTWAGLPIYGESDETSNEVSNNLVLTVKYGGTYTITTNQDRYLNVVAGKVISVSGDMILPALQLRAGNIYNLLTSENKVDLSDASMMTALGTYGAVGDPLLLPADANFDGTVNIQDLALVGGNFDLTSALAYANWLP